MHKTHTTSPQYIEDKIRETFSKWILRQAVPELPSDIGWRKDKVAFDTPHQKIMMDTNWNNLFESSVKKLKDKRYLSFNFELQTINSNNELYWRILVAGEMFY
jgi:hypothetical protein